jgi:hypothetical protein
MHVRDCWNLGKNSLFAPRFAYFKNAANYKYSFELAIAFATVIDKSFRDINNLRH